MTTCRAAYMLRRVTFRHWKMLSKLSSRNQWFLHLTILSVRVELVHC